MPSTPPPSSNADLVRDRLRARARRIAVIRRRVVAAALATFAIAFGTIAATGSLGSAGATATTGSGQSDTAITANPTSTGSASSGSHSSDSSSSDSSSSGSTSGASSSTGSAVTTGQS